MKTLLCDCNQTLPLNREGLIKALGPQAAEGIADKHSLLCRREAGAFQRAAKEGEDLFIACTQEQPLFEALNGETEGALSLTERPIRFFNLREMAGWGEGGKAATPKMAALIAAAQLPPPEPVGTVAYESQGRCLIIGPAEAAQGLAPHLTSALQVTLLVDGGAQAQSRAWAVHAGRLKRLTGWLGTFEATWEQGNPIDLDVCTRCNACVQACPEGAIGLDYQVDLNACKSHRSCVAVCEVAAAIDFNRPAQERQEPFDVVIDMRREPAFGQHQPPQGYFHVGLDAASGLQAALQAREMVGTFDKPRFFNYKRSVCAHSRNEQAGCTACVDICSASAVRSDREGTGGIVVEPHLCVGCGACTTACPTGALSYATPDAATQGKRLRTVLSTYQRAGGQGAALLLHNQEAGERVLMDLGRAAQLKQARGLPAHVIPLPLWHSASVGLELWLAAKAWGAAQVLVLLTDDDAPAYAQALGAQAELANTLLQGLGWPGEHVRVLHARDARDLAALDAGLREAPPTAVSKVAGFAAMNDKRTTLELALEHLITVAPALPEAVALPSGLAASPTPWGSVNVNAQTCTLCLACVGACPAGALQDNPEAPQLKFIEKNCVQCGLCETTCPENAITLSPRLWLAEGGRARKQPRVLHEAVPFACVRCGKGFGTLRAIEAMVSKLSGHAMFQGAAQERLKMCGDCRVIDIHTNPGEVRITDL